MDDIQISKEDQERINSMVAQYRHSITNLYKMGYLKGCIDSDSDTVAKLRKVSNG